MDGEFGGLGRTLPDLLSLQRSDVAVVGAPDARSRIDALTRLERMLIDNRSAFGAAISADFGNRSLTETDMLEIVPALNAIRHARRNVTRWMKPEKRHVGVQFQPGKATVRYQPLGVVGIMAPWNYPLLLCVAPMVDAIAAGNRVMVKPSEYTPAFSSLLARLAGEAFPPTHVAVVQGGPEIAAAFSALPFDHLLFTGSTATGRKVAMAAAANLTPVTLELGGKSPAIVCPDADLGKAAKSIAFGKFINGGQTCIAPDYVLIDEARADAFVDVMVDRVRRSYRTVANNPDYTSMISERHQSRLLAAIGEAEAAGARVVRVHGSETASGRAIGPVLVRGAPADGLLMSEEIFGPVLPIVTYRDLGQAMAQINARDRPLALYAFTRSQGSLERVLGGTISGGVTVNGTILHIAQDDLPFGGVGPSGIGAYHGFDGFKRFSHARSVFEIGFMNGFEMLAPPYGQLAKRAANVLIGRGKRVRRD